MACPAELLQLLLVQWAVLVRYVLLQRAMPNPVAHSLTDAAAAAGPSASAQIKKPGVIAATGAAAAAAAAAALGIGTEEGASPGYLPVDEVATLLRYVVLSQLAYNDNKHEVSCRVQSRSHVQQYGASSPHVLTCQH